MLKAKQGKICKNYSQYVKRFNTQGVYAHGQAVSFIIRHNTFIYLHMFQKNSTRCDVVRSCAITGPIMSSFEVLIGFEWFWQGQKQDNFLEAYRANSLCYTDAFSARLLRNLWGCSFILPFLPDPNWSLHNPSHHIMFHCVPLQPCISMYSISHVYFKQLPRRSKRSPGYQCLLLNNEFLLFFLPRTWHDLTNCRNGGKAHFDSLGVTWCHHASHNFVTFFGVTQHHILDHIRQIDTKKNGM